MTRQTLIPQLLGIFRQYGYDGASIAKISQETGMGKASLYHHFPQGKAEMAQAVLAYLNDWRQQHVLEPLQADGTPKERLIRMTQALCEVYQQGAVPCMLAVLNMGSTRESFLPQIQPALSSLMNAIAAVVMDAGFAESIAMERAENAVIQIQGSLMLSRALQNNAAFKRVMHALPTELLKAV